MFLLNESLFDLRSEKRNKELYIFEKGVFWSGPGRQSRVFRSRQGRKMCVGGGGGWRGAFRDTYPRCPYMGVPTHPRGGGRLAYFFKLPVLAWVCTVDLQMLSLVSDYEFHKHFTRWSINRFVQTLLRVFGILSLYSRVHYWRSPNSATIIQNEEGYTHYRTNSLLVITGIV